MADRHDRSPESIRQWQGIARDFLAYAIATFLFVFGALKARSDVNALGAMFGAGLLLLGLPSAIRLDRAIRRDEGEDR